MTSILNPHLDGTAPLVPVVTIQLDGQAHEVPQGSTLAQLVKALGHEEKAVSTAVNGDFVARSARDRVLNKGDAVLLFQPIVGG
ncbi:sulfur carrier protein ThiS [Ottowia thiooxydans]|uniref:Sulfur carrier protein n=1 Tax=Ottowia thiooxydans TaxID=219182 RepID=A0ABV2Q6F0_9BURK